MSEFRAELQEMGYAMPRQLDDSRWLALQQMIYTWRLFLIEDGDAVGWRSCWDYKDFVQAAEALHTWDGVGDDPGGPWVKQKGRASTGEPVDRLNPRLAEPHSDF